MAERMKEESEIVALYKEGNTISDIAKKYGKYNTSIRRVLHRNGCKTPNASETQTNVSNSLFAEMNNVEEYWYGFLLGDGYVAKKRNRITLALHEKDKRHLEKYVLFLGGKPSIRQYTHSCGSVITRVSFSNKKVHERLTELGVTSNKSFTAKAYSMTWNIFRGLFDADGSFVVTGSSQTFSIATASTVLKDQLFAFLITKGINPKLSKTVNVWIIRLHKKEEVKLLLLSMYENAHTYLDRKYEKCHAWLKDQEK